VDPDQVLQSLTPDTVLISIMAANNETGVLQPIEAISRIARSRGILFHTDAVQAFGKVPVSVDDLGIDLMTLSAHKIYGPKGVGALYVRKGSAMAPVLTGGSHERGKRAGTENIAAIAGFAKAAELAVENLAQDAVHMTALRDAFEEQVVQRIAQVRVNGRDASRVPNTSSMSFASVDGESILLHLDLKGICASTGSACATGSAQPSHVMRAMGLSPMDAQSTIRFSLGRDTSQGDLDFTVRVLEDTIEKLRYISSTA
jgi:cysteine desulfurase